MVKRLKYFTSSNRKHIECATKKFWLFLGLVCKLGEFQWENRVEIRGHIYVFLSCMDQSHLGLGRGRTTADEYW